MSDKLKKALIGALVAVALAVAVSYGLISQQTADKIQTETNQTLSQDQSPAPQQMPPAPQNPAAPAPAAPNPAPAPR
ncbi:hypothetical protein [Methylobacterium brachythecii]|nr:hypothetical protein [Methylobacterium brachythecii]